MTDYKDLLKSLEEATGAIQDPELKKIAFQELLRNALQTPSGTTRAEKPAKAVATAAPKAKPNRAKQPTKGTRTPSVRESVKALDINPDEKGLPTWSSLTQDWKKFCWILEAAKLKGIDGLTPAEISYLIERVFRESFTTAQVANLKVKLKAGLVKAIKVEGGANGWKILSGGTKELANPAQAEKKA
jgi:hypothetical protein